MFIAVLFTNVKLWKQTKCSSADKWIKKMWYIYIMGYYSAIKTMNFRYCNNMDEPGSY